MIAACKYFNAVFQSIQLAIYNGPCEAHYGSPASEGKLQYHLWDKDPLPTHMWDQKPLELLNIDGEILWTVQTFSDLEECVKIHGMYNSVLMALPPTASTAEMWNVQANTSPPFAIQHSKQTINGNLFISNREFYYAMKNRNLFTCKVSDYI